MALHAGRYVTQLAVWWSSRSWLERSLWVGAVTCALLAVGLKPVARSVAPQLAVSAKGTACARYDSKARDPWGQPWRFKAPLTTQRYAPGSWTELVTIHFPQDYANLSLVEDLEAPGYLQPPRPVRRTWISDDYTRYSVGPNGVDEGLSGDDLAPEYLPGAVYQPLMWPDWAFLSLGVLLAWAALIVKQVREPRWAGALRESARAIFITSLPAAVFAAAVGAFWIKRQVWLNDRRELGPVGDLLSLPDGPTAAILAAWTIMVARECKNRRVAGVVALILGALLWATWVLVERGIVGARSVAALQKLVLVPLPVAVVGTFVLVAFLLFFAIRARREAACE